MGIGFRAMVALAGLLILGCAVTAGPGREEVARFFIADMEDEHDLKPAGVGGADWGRHARRGMRKLPEGWSCAIMWGQIYPPEDGELPANVRVQIRNARLWFLSRRDGEWHLLKASAGVEGASYRLDFAGDESVPTDIRKEEDGSVSVRMAPGRNFHFWPPDGRVEVDPDDVAAMASSFEARLLVADPAKPADLGSARLLGSCGGDFWQARDSRWDKWKTNGDWAIGRFKLITPEWKAFTGTSAEAGVLRENPPPLALPGKNQYGRSRLRRSAILR